MKTYAKVYLLILSVVTTFFSNFLAAAEVGNFSLPTLGLDMVVQVEGESAFPLNRMSKVLVVFQPKGNSKAALSDISSVEFDARMPEHNHGMVVRPRVQRLSPDKFLVQGVKLHMAGDWEVKITVAAQQKKEIVTLKVHL